jgi:hypothetical protein
MFSAVLLTTAMGLGQPVPPPPPVVVVAKPIHHPPGINFVTEPNFIRVTIIGDQCGTSRAIFDPYLYPVVPAAVVVKHPNWYRWPGPAFWYTNNVTPYNAVYHKPVPPPPVDPKKKKN